MAFSRSASGLILPKTISDRRDAQAMFSNFETFARNGRVILRRPDAQGRDQEERSLSIASAIHRRDALAEQAAVLRKQGIASTIAREKAKVIEVFVERLSEVIRDAQEQGEIDDKSMRDARMRSRPVTVSVPAMPTSKQKT